jgi:hypothetical protein
LGAGDRTLIRALLSEGEATDRLCRESIASLGGTRIRAQVARAYLLYGEWLRRERRGIDAREQLRIAHAMLDPMGIEAFADRACRELAAIGETAASGPSRPSAGWPPRRPGRAAGPRRPVQPGDRRPPVHQRARSSTTWARSSPSSPSAPAASFTASFQCSLEIRSSCLRGGADAVAHARPGADCEPYLDGACSPASQTARIRRGPRSLGYRVPEWDEAGVGAAQHGHRPGRRAVRAGEQAQRYRQRQDISARCRGLDARRLAAVP